MTVYNDRVYRTRDYLTIAESFKQQFFYTRWRLLCFTFTTYYMTADLIEFKTFNSQCIKHNIPVVIVLMHNFYCHNVDHLFVLSLV